MRSARVELGSGGGPIRSFLVRSASDSFLHHECHPTTATQIPGEKLETVYKKNPSVATSERPSREQH